MNAMLENAISKYVDHIKADYIAWHGDLLARSPSIQQEMIARFLTSVKVEVGSKYANIVANGSAHSFVVIKEGKFSSGTILKSASWASPATNFARGNVLDTSSYQNRVTWTGAV